MAQLHVVEQQSPSLLEMPNLQPTEQPAAKNAHSEAPPLQPTEQPAAENAHSEATHLQPTEQPAVENAHSEASADPIPEGAPSPQAAAVNSDSANLGAEPPTNVPHSDHSDPTFDSVNNAEAGVHSMEIDGSTESTAPVNQAPPRNGGDSSSSNDSDNDSASPSPGNVGGLRREINMAGGLGGSQIRMVLQLPIKGDFIANYEEEFHTRWNRAFGMTGHSTEVATFAKDGQAILHCRVTRYASQSVCDFIQKYI